MVMICGYHVLEHCGVLAAVQPGSAGEGAAWLLCVLCYAGVNLFAMASGYLGARGRFRLSSVAVRWLQVVCYTVSITLLAAVLWPGMVGKQELLNAVCPVSFEQYWYVTAYFGMVLFTPVLQYALANMPIGQLALCTGGVLGVLSVQQTALQFDVFGTNNGYSALWLIALYLCGGLWRRLEDGAPRCAGRAAAAAAALCFAVVWAFRMKMDGHPDVVSGTLLMRYTSPLMVAASLALLIAFTRIRRASDWLRRGMAALSGASFGVYLIHEHPFIRAKLMAGRFAPLAALPAPVMALGVVLSALGIFLGCAAMDMLRAAVFERLHVRGAAQRLEEMLAGGLRGAMKRYRAGR